MAVRFSASNQALSSTTAVPDPTAGFTVTCWAMLSLDQDVQAVLFRLRNSTGGANGVHLATGIDGTTLRAWNTDSTESNGVLAMTPGIWYRVAFTVTGTTSVFYAGADTGSLTVTTDATWTANNAPNQLIVGGNLTSASTQYWNGRIAHLRVWSAVLTQAEITAELASATAVITTGLLRSHSFTDGTNLVPDAGTGGNLTAGAGATTTEDDPNLNPPAAVHYKSVTNTLRPRLSR